MIFLSSANRGPGSQSHDLETWESLRELSPVTQAHKCRLWTAVSRHREHSSFIWFFLRSLRGSTSKGSMPSDAWPQGRADSHLAAETSSTTRRLAVNWKSLPPMWAAIRSRETRSDARLATSEPFTGVLRRQELRAHCENLSLIHI